MEDFKIKPVEELFFTGGKYYTFLDQEDFMFYADKWNKNKRAIEDLKPGGEFVLFRTVRHPEDPSKHAFMLLQVTVVMNWGHVLFFSHHGPQMKSLVTEGFGTHWFFLPMEEF